MSDVTAVPFAEFLEEGVREIVRINPKGVLLAAIAGNGQVLIGTDGCTSADIAILLHEIQMRDIFERIRLAEKEDGEQLEEGG